MGKGKIGARGLPPVSSFIKSPAMGKGKVGVREPVSLPSSEARSGPPLLSAQSSSSSLSSNLDNVNSYIKSVANDIVASAKAQSNEDLMDLDLGQSKGLKRKPSSITSDSPPKKLPELSSGSSASQQIVDDGWQTVGKGGKKASPARVPSTRYVNRPYRSNSSAQAPSTRTFNRSFHWDKDQLRVFASSHDMSSMDLKEWNGVEDFVMDAVMDSFDRAALDGDLLHLPEIFFHGGIKCGVLKCSPSSILFFKSLINERFEGSFRAWSVSDNPLHLVRLYIPYKFNKYAPERWIKGIFSLNQLSDHPFTLVRTVPEGGGRAVFFRVEDRTRSFFASHGWSLEAPIGTALLSSARSLPPPLRQLGSSQPQSQSGPPGTSSSNPPPLVPVILEDFPPLSPTVQLAKSSGPLPPPSTSSGGFPPLSTDTSQVCSLEPPEPFKSISRSVPLPSSCMISQPKSLVVESSISSLAPVVNGPNGSRISSECTINWNSSPSSCIDQDVHVPSCS